MTLQELTDIKRQIRKEIAARKRSLTSYAREQASQRLCEALANESGLAVANSIVAYWPMADEIDVRPFISIAMERGQNVFLPMMVGEELVFRQYTGFTCLRTDSKYGIWEPHDTPELVSADGKGVGVVTPGVAFTESGARLGRGRGFYDRAFEVLPRAWKVGVAYDCQMMRELPTEQHDQRMDIVLHA